MQDAHKTLGEFVTERFNRARLFEELGIDYCYNGHKPLALVCAEENLNLKEVLSKIQALDERTPEVNANSLANISLSALVDQITQEHHLFLKKELSHLTNLLEHLLARSCPEKQTDLWRLKVLFSVYSSNLVLHIEKEEQILFSNIKALESSALTGDTAIQLNCDLIKHPVGQTCREHEKLKEEFQNFKALIMQFVPSEDAAGTYWEIVNLFAKIEHDLSVHLHKENNMLFPKALQLCSMLSGKQCCIKQPKTMSHIPD